MQVIGPDHLRQVFEGGQKPIIGRAVNFNQRDGFTANFAAAKMEGCDIDSFLAAKRA